MYYLCVYKIIDNVHNLIFSYDGSLETIHDILWQQRFTWSDQSFDWSIYFESEVIEFKESFNYVCS